MREESGVQVVWDSQSDAISGNVVEGDLCVWGCAVEICGGGLSVRGAGRACEASGNVGPMPLVCVGDVRVVEISLSK